MSKETVRKLWGQNPPITKKMIAQSHLTSCKEASPLYLKSCKEVSPLYLRHLTSLQTSCKEVLPLYLEIITQSHLSSDDLFTPPYPWVEWKGLKIGGGNLIHRKNVFCIRCQSIWAGISGDNLSSRIFGWSYKFQDKTRQINLRKTHALLRLANAVSPLHSTRGYTPNIYVHSRIHIIHREYVYESVYIFIYTLSYTCYVYKCGCTREYMYL